MAITAYDPCGETIGAFVPEASCLEEGSRIVGGYLVKKGFDLESLSDGAAITTAIAAKNLIPVVGLTGNWAPGTSNKKPGMGFQREKHSSFSFSIPIKHYSVDGNLAFWNKVNNSNDYSIAFVFEDLSIWGCLDRSKEVIPMDIVMSPASDEELGGVRRFEGTASWTSKDLPYPLLAPVVAGFTKAVLRAQFS
ncbi:MAG: hypothetical protein ACK5QX_10100 [bacterium]|jgi:hypothetical protein